MATYTITDYELKLLLFNVGEPFGYVPVCVCNIKDNWASDLIQADSILANAGILTDILNFLDSVPCIASLGGTQSQFNDSVFYGVQYPINSDNSPVYLTVYTSGGAYTSVRLELKHRTIGTITAVNSNVLEGRAKPMVLMADDSGVYRTGGGISPDFDAFNSSYSSYEHFASNNGLPYGISSGYSLHSTSDVTAPFIQKIPWADFDYKTPDVPSTDPYSPGGISGPSSGSGTFDLTSDTISIPGLPTLSATNAGLVTVYVPTSTQLNTFASLLFGRTFLDAFLNAVTTLFVDPLEAVIGLSIIPVSPTLATSKQVTVAFIGLTTPDGPLMMQPAASQYVEVNCGTIHVDEYSGSALDYAPYSKFHIYLPYIGTRELSTDEIRNKDLRVVYHIDIVSGSCVALLEVDGSVLYQFAGNCATPIPINGRDFSRMVTAGIQLAAAFAGGSAGAGVGSVAAGNIRKPADYISTNSSFKTLVKTLDSEEGVMPTANKTAGTGVDAEHLVSATAGVVAGMKPHIQHASGIGGSAGMLGVQKPYLIAEIPRQSLAQDYNKFVGYPSNITSVLGDLSGFTQIEMIHLKGIPCTETELSEIDKMLKSGVIL